MNEQELIIQLAQGDEAAFRWLVEHYRNRLFSCVMNMLQDAGEAEDCLQETFIQVFESIGKFNGECALATWMYRIAVRKALMKLRQRRVGRRLQALLPWWMPQMDKPDDGRYNNPGIAVEHREKVTVLFSAIYALPQQQQLAFLLIRVDGMSYREACEIMQISTKALESLVGRARVNLQKRLETYYRSIK